MNRTDDKCYTGTGPAAEVVGQVRQTKHILASEQRPRDGLPRFRSSSDGRTISDEDFIFDALLRVGGDFKTDSVRLAYAQWVCNALNDADKLLLGSPEVASVPQGRPTYTELLAQRDELRAEVERLRTDGASAVRWAPGSAYWSDVLRELFGPNARDGINVIEVRWRAELERADTAEALLRQALDALELRCGTNADECKELIPALRERLGVKA